MRLAELQPRWFTVGDDGARDGLTFLCPCSACRAGTSPMRLAVQFANPIGAAPKPILGMRQLSAALAASHGADERKQVVPPGFLWTRTGEDFETLTLSPSVDASPAGHWHGFVTGGEIR